MTIANTPPITIAQGADVAIQCSPVTVTNISTWTLVGYFTLNPGSVPIYTLTQSSGISFDGTGGTDGVFIVSLTRTQTGVLNPGSYYLAVWRTNSGDSDPLLTTNINLILNARPFP